MAGAPLTHSPPSQASYTSSSKPGGPWESRVTATGTQGTVHWAAQASTGSWEQDPKGCGHKQKHKLGRKAK